MGGIAFGAFSAGFRWGKQENLGCIRQTLEGYLVKIAGIFLTIVKYLQKNHLKDS